jgi:hypothetical protein
VGNAVPSAIAELLGLEIRRQLFGEKVKREVRHIPAARSDCPLPERSAHVPKQYLDLRGRHREHPGTGRGPGARRPQRHPSLRAGGIRHASNPAARAIFDATHLLAAEAAGAEVLLTFNSLDFRRLRAADSPHIEESLSPPNLRNVIERRKDLMRAPLI